MPNISIRTLLTGLTVLLGILAVALASNSLIRRINTRSTAQIVAAYASVDRDLFLSLTRLRIERGYGSAALLAEPGTNKQNRGISVGARASLDDSMNAAVKGVAANPLPELARTTQDIEGLVGTWKRMRQEVDAAYDRPVSARDSALPKRFNDLGGAILKTLETAAVALETEIQALDPTTAALLNARSTAWLARTNSGDVGAVINNTIAADRAATDDERAALRAAETRAVMAWAIVGRIVSPTQVAAPVKAAYAAANAAYFDGPFQKMRNGFIATIAEGGKPAIVGDAWSQGLFKGHASIVEAAVAIMDALVAQAESRAEDAQRGFMLFLAIAVAAMALSVAATLTVHRRVVRGIHQLSGAMGAISAGKVETAVPGIGRGDEIGAMAAAVQVFKDNLIRTIALEAETAQARMAAEELRKAGMRQMADAFEANVGGIIGLVSASATQLQATAQAMTATATRTVGRSTTVAAAAEEAASNVNTVAAAAEELGSSVQEIGRQVAGSAELAQKAVAEAGETGARVEDLSAAVSRIGDVVAMISTIAGQTNLLALNATIEAARAGAAGRGFAVVATEVKELAAQTAKATEEISGQIARVQTSTGHAVVAIGSITARIKEISGVATSIAAAVEEQGAATHEIVRNVSEAATGTGEVTSNIAGVAEAIEETGAAANQVLGASSELSRQSEHLASEVGRFLADVRAA